jgi:hypothetical protein
LPAHLLTAAPWIVKNLIDRNQLARYLIILNFGGKNVKQLPKVQKCYFRPARVRRSKIQLIYIKP